MKLSKISKARGKPRILQIGAGRWGQTHLKVWLELLRRGIIRELIVVERNSDHRQELKKKYGIDAAEHLSAALLQEADGIDIVTQPSTHAELVTESLRYAPVFVEKPLTLTGRSAQSLASVAKRAEYPLFVGHIYRFHPVVRELKLFIGKYGQPVSIHCQFHDRPEILPKDCGILFSDLHPFDILDYLLDRHPTEMAVQTATVRDGFETSVGVMMRYAPATSATVQLSWEALPKTRELIVTFPDRTVYADLAAQTLTTVTPTRRSIKKYPGNGPLSAELTAFVRLIEGKRVEYPHASVGARIVGLVEQAKKLL